MSCCDGLFALGDWLCQPEGLIQGFLKAIEESGVPACRIETCALECLRSGNQHKGFLCAAGCGVKKLTGKQRRWGVGQQHANVIGFTSLTLVDGDGVGGDGIRDAA